MTFAIFGTSLILAMLFIPLLAWKWRIKLSVSIIAGVIIGLFTGCLTALFHLVAPQLTLIILLPIEITLIVLITILGVMLRFYRDPERHPTETQNVILSPADGKIIYIKEVEKDSSLVVTKGGIKFGLNEVVGTNLLRGAIYLVGIEMNVLNVHVNRSPINGKVLLQKRTKGKFMSLRKPEAKRVNERVTTIISEESLTVGVVQIASRLVRKIICYVGQNDKVEIGQRIGMIAFGSQVDLTIPHLETLKIVVKPGDETKAGESVIARY